MPRHKVKKAVSENLKKAWAARRAKAAERRAAAEAAEKPKKRGRPAGAKTKKAKVVGSATYTWKSKPTQTELPGLDTNVSASELIVRQGHRILEDLARLDAVESNLDAATQTVAIVNRDLQRVVIEINERNAVLRGIIAKLELRVDELEVKLSAYEANAAPAPVAERHDEDFLNDVFGEQRVGN